MARTTVTRADEATLVRRARTGDREAFDEVHERHGPAAWRVAAVTAPDQATAEAALADGVARTVQGDVLVAGPIRTRVLAATLSHAAGGDPGASGAWLPAPEDATGADAQLFEAFAGLPHRYRTALWLADAERIPSAQAALVLGQAPAELADLADRARAALRTSLDHRVLADLSDGTVCHRARTALAVGSGASARERAGAEAHATGCEPCRGHQALLASAPLALRSVLALPAAPDSDRAWARWQALRAEGTTRPLGIALPGGRVPPVWVERALAGAAAAAITLGVAGAIALGARDATRGDHGNQPAASSQPAGATGGESAASKGRAEPEPLAPVELDPAPPPPAPIEIGGADPAPKPPAAVQSASSPAPPTPAPAPAPAPAPPPAPAPAPPPPAAPAPVEPAPAPSTADSPRGTQSPDSTEPEDDGEQLDLKLSDDVGISVGECTGVKLGGTTLGC
jgi:hypothetical protein